MIHTKELDGANWEYNRSLVAFNQVKGNLRDSINHLKYTKNLVIKGVVKHGAYQSYKATTAKHRFLLKEALKQARQNKHEKYKNYDSLQKEYNKQNPQDTLIQDALLRLNKEQQEVLKIYFKNL
jgi:hypothetical protein